MKKNLWTIFVFFPLLLLAEEATTTKSNIMLGIEAGYDYIHASAKSIDKAYNGTWAFVHSPSYTSSPKMDIIYIGIKPEFLFAKNRLGIATGIRFLQYQSEFHQEDIVWWDYGNTNLFNLTLYGPYESGLLPLTSITQKSYWIGIPLELKCFLTKKDKFFQPYIKFSSAFNFLVATKNDINIIKERDETSDHYAEVTNITQEQIENPDIFNIRTSLAFGLKIGRSKCPFGNIEIHIPSVMIHSENISPFVVPKGGLGFQCSLQIPLKNVIQ